MTIPCDRSTPNLNSGAVSGRRDCRNIVQYFSGARGRSKRLLRVAEAYGDVSHDQLLQRSTESWQRLGLGYEVVFQALAHSH